MKTRVITALVGLPLIFLTAIFAPLWAFGILMSIVSVFAVHELMHCAAPGSRRRRVLWPMLSAAAIPLFTSLGLDTGWCLGVLYCLVFIVFCELMLSFKEPMHMDLTAVTVSILSGGVLPLMLSGVLRMGQTAHVGRALLLLPFIIEFSCDAGAYFAGRAIGGPRLAPHLSPKKTVAGAVGGLAAAVLCSGLYGLLLGLFGIRARFWSLLLCAVLGGAASQLGDLSFSAIKRICCVKDYGSVLPGHGGMLDRFDSMYYLAPLLEGLTLLLAPFEPVAALL